MKNDTIPVLDNISGPDKTAENQVGASGWFVRVNLFARSQNRWFGRLAVWWFGRLDVIEYIGRVCYTRLKGVLQSKTLIRIITLY